MLVEFARRLPDYLDRTIVVRDPATTVEMLVKIYGPPAELDLPPLEHRDEYPRAVD